MNPRDECIFNEYYIFIDIYINHGIGNIEPNKILDKYNSENGFRISLYNTYVWIRVMMYNKD